MKKVCVALLLVWSHFVSNAQIDKVFWFAAPEVVAAHGDEPIVLRLTSFDKPAEITISFPANKELKDIEVVLPPSSSTTINLTSLKDELENYEPNVVSNKGIYIESTSEITAYYEVNNKSNPDIFALKGRNGLGKEFYTPFQNTFNNYDTTYQDNFAAYSAIDIVATEDSTEVTIVPSVDAFGHTKGIPFTIKMNKGQTYSVRAKDGLTSSHLVGTHITSTKRIAVTIKDDSVVNGSSYDLIGDQLIPVAVLGKKYIVSAGRGYVLAVEDNTVVQVGDSSVTLEKGEQYYIPTITSPIYITSTEPVYVLQISNFPFSNELGGAILPPLGCTGSRKISFTKSVDGGFLLLVIVKAGHEGDFLLNKSRRYVRAALFQNITTEWSFAEINMDGVLDGETSFALENTTADFHLGIINTDSDGYGTRFGYFSDFGIVDLGEDQKLCEGDSLQLDAGISKDSYLWSTGSTKQVIEVTTGGIYKVKVTKGECTDSSSVEIVSVENVTIHSFGNDTTICSVDSVVLLPGAKEDVTYVWQDNSVDTFFVAKQAGVYKVKMTNENGCFNTEDIVINVIYKPEINLGNDTVVCAASEYVLSLPSVWESYVWSTSSTDTSIVVTEPGLYSVNVSNKCGSDADGIIVDFWKVEVPNVVTPNQDGKNDSFLISGIDKGEWSLVVRNRWGSEVYNNPYYQNTFSPETLASGVYYYRLQEQSECNEFIGWLLIER